MVSPPINKTDNIDEIENVGIVSFHDGPQYDDILQSAGDYTSRVGYNNDVTNDHTIPIAQPRDPVISEIPTKLRRLAEVNELTGHKTPGTLADGVGGRQPAAGHGSRRQGRPAGGMASNPGKGVVTRSNSRAAPVLLTTTIPRGLQ